MDRGNPGIATNIDRTICCSDIDDTGIVEDTGTLAGTERSGIIEPDSTTARPSGLNRASIDDRVSAAVRYENPNATCAGSINGSPGANGNCIAPGVNGDVGNRGWYSRSIKSNDPSIFDTDTRTGATGCRNVRVQDCGIAACYEV
jgi:hypothetical protein